jgi:hypothetical protein
MEIHIIQSDKNPLCVDVRVDFTKPYCVQVDIERLKTESGKLEIIKDLYAIFVMQFAMKVVDEAAKKVKELGLE